MILFPINAKKPRKGDATAEEMSKAVQLAGTKVILTRPASQTSADRKLKVMAPKALTKRPRAMAITADMQAFKAFQTIRQVIIADSVFPNYSDGFHCFSINYISF